MGIDINIPHTMQRERVHTMEKLTSNAIVALNERCTTPAITPPPL